MYFTNGSSRAFEMLMRGKPSFDRYENGGCADCEDCNIISPIEQHSKKPDEARDKILALMGNLPRVELFARQKTPGWDAWGNEIASDITLAERS